MTEILTFTCQEYTVQVSDRLVTVGANPYDRDANKAIIFAAPDGVVCIGYSGLAYIGGLPTDEWIALTLWGRPVVRFGERVPMCFGVKPSRSDIGRSLFELYRSLCTEWSKLPRNESVQNLSIDIAGWQWNTRFLRPVHYRINKDRGNNRIFINKWARNCCQAKPHYVLTEVGGWVGEFPECRDFLFDQLKGLSQSTGAHRAVEAVLANTIRMIAGHTTLVGKDLMSVVIENPNTTPIRVHFMPFEPKKAYLSGATFQQEIEARFSPWIVGPCTLVSPSVLSCGNFNVNLGHISVEIDGGNSLGGPLLSMMNSQERQSKPGKNKLRDNLGKISLFNSS